MISFARKSAYTTARWMLLLALTVTTTGLLQVLNLKPVLADDGGYPWANATYVDANYDWGYSTCPSNDTGCMSLSGTLSGTTYGEADPWVYYLRNCTSYAAWKINQVFGVSNITGWGNATTWDTGVLPNHPQTYTVYAASGHTPQVGEIAQWDNAAGGLGHVAYVYAVNNGIASLADYNEGTPIVNGNPTWGVYWTGGVTGSSPEGTPDHYIHIGTVPSPNPLRIGEITTGGSYKAKEGSLDSGWVTMSNDSATQIMQDGTLSGMIWNSQFYAKQGALTNSWITVANANAIGGSLSDADGTTAIRDGLLLNTGYFYAREGFTNSWTLESTNVVAGYVSGNRIAVLKNDGSFWVKEGAVDSTGWVEEYSSGVTQGAISGGSYANGLIGVLVGGTLLVKQGSLSSGWVTEQGSVASFQLSNGNSTTGPRIGYVDTSNNFYAKDGLSGGWVLEGNNVSNIALSGQLLGKLQSGTYTVLQGALTASNWITEDGSISQIALWSPN